METRNVSALRKIFGSHIRYYRRERGWTQAELAERCDLSLDMIGRLERGGASPSLDTMAKLSEVLNIDAAILMGGSPFADDGPSERETKLQRLFALLTEIETDDLDRIEKVLAAVIRG